MPLPAGTGVIADDAFCVACHDETAGNPLLLHELVRAVAAERLAATEASVPRLRELGARAGARAVSLGLSRLPPEATALAQADAILGGRLRSGPGPHSSRGSAFSARTRRPLDLTTTDP